MQSPHDQDAAYRLKINGQKKQRVRGFASNITETCDKENELQIITSVQTEKVTHSDTAFFQQAIENTEKIVGQIEEVTTDGAYNSPANKDYIEDREQTQYLSALALIFSATVSGIHIWQNRFQKNLMLYADGAQELWQLKRDLQHIEKMADESREEVLKSFYFEFRKTVDELHEQWKKTSSDSSEE